MRCSAWCFRKVPCQNQRAGQRHEMSCGGQDDTTKTRMLSWQMWLRGPVPMILFWQLDITVECPLPLTLPYKDSILQAWLR